jgi:aminoglycoside phosphotransferase (APT) family kinase protein
MVLCHNDLRAEHIILGEGGRTVSGIIDWSDAVLGDPAQDLALLWLDFGPDVLDRVLASYHGPHDGDLRRRTRWFTARAGVEGVAYRALHALPSVDRLLASLRQVLTEGRP